MLAKIQSNENSQTGGGGVNCYSLANGVECLLKLNTCIPCHSDFTPRCTRNGDGHACAQEVCNNVPVALFLTASKWKQAK